MKLGQRLFGLKVPEGTDRRELYKSQYRAIYTYKMSASEPTRRPAPPSRATGRTAAGASRTTSA